MNPTLATAISAAAIAFVAAVGLGAEGVAFAQSATGAQSSIGQPAGSALQTSGPVGAKVSGESGVLVAQNAAPAAATGDAATAQSGEISGSQLQEVVVTAERRTTDIQRAPASISVRTGSTLLQEAKNTTAEILEDVVGVTVVSAAASATLGSDNQGANIVIRGVVSNGSTGFLPTVPTTAVYTDGVYEGIGNNYDVNRVEVLRGPQGTDYGRSATSGVVATYTNDPKLRQFGGDASVEFGNYSVQHYTGALNLPAGDTVALRLAADQYRQDGYYSKDGLGQTETTQGRVKFLFEPNQNLSIQVAAALQGVHNGSGGATQVMTGPESWNIKILPPTSLLNSSNSSQQYWANIQWNLGPATLTYIPALRTWYQNGHTWVSGPGGGDVQQTLFAPTDEYHTQELRLASNTGSKLTWSVGGLYYHNILYQDETIAWLESGGLLVGGNARRYTRGIGAFGEATYPFTPATRLTLGLRYDNTYVQTDESYTNNANIFCGTPLYKNSPPSPSCVFAPFNTLLAGTPPNYTTLFVGGSAGTRSWDNVTYKALLEHDLTPNSLGYASIATGFLPGSVQVATVGNQPVADPFDEETLTAYELGIKNSFLEHTLLLNGDVWYYRYGGYQTVVSPILNPAEMQYVLIPARMFGLELSFQYQFTPSDRFTLDYGYTDAYWVDEPATFVQNYAQSHIVGVVPQMINVTYDHLFQLPGGSTLTPHADARLIGAHNVSSIAQSYVAQGGTPYIHAPDEVVGDLSLTWAIGRYSLTGYVRNVADNRYKTGAGVQAVVPLNATVTPYMPRTYGVIGSVTF